MSRKVMTEAEDAAFERLWTLGESRESLMKMFGLAGPGSVGSVCRRLGLQPRHPRRKAAPAVPDDAVPIVVPVMPAHPFWTPERDLVVMATAGNYRALSAAAQSIGRPVTYVQLRWHQLRAA